MAVNKVVLGNNTLVDLTGDTVTADKLAVGATAHASNGEVVNGTLDTYTKTEIDSLLDDKISEYSDAVLGNFRSTGATNLGNGAVNITATALPAQSNVAVQGSCNLYGNVQIGSASGGSGALPSFNIYNPANFAGGVVADTLFKLIDVSGGISIAKGDGNGGDDLTSAEWTAVLAAGYVPVAIAAVYSGSSYWPLYQAAIKQDLSGIHISIRRFDGTVSSATVINATARVLFVKMS